MAESYPVDFYSELSPYHLKVDTTEQILFKRYRDKVEKCHDTELRKENIRLYREGCPTKYIRWHFTDSRAFSDEKFNTIEAYIFSPFYYYFFSQQATLKLYSNILPFTGMYYDTKDENLIYWGHIFIMNFYSTLMNSLDKSDEDLLVDLIHLFFEFIESHGRQSVLYKQMIQNHQIDWGDCLKSSIESSSNKISFKYIINEIRKINKNYPEVFLNIYNRMDVSEEHLLIDDLDIETKRSVDIQWNLFSHLIPLPEGWRKIKKGGIVFYFDDVSKEYKLDPPSIPKDKIPYYKDALLYLSVLFSFFSNSLLDMYFISRMVKKPKNGMSSSLTVAYFGDNHCKKISEILKRKFDYIEVYSENNSSILNASKNLRCIEIEETLFLESAIKTRNSYIENFNEKNEELYLHL